MNDLTFSNVFFKIIHLYSNRIFWINVMDVHGFFSDRTCLKEKSWHRCLTVLYLHILYSQYLFIVELEQLVYRFSHHICFHSGNRKLRVFKWQSHDWLNSLNSVQFCNIICVFQKLKCPVFAYTDLYKSRDSKEIELG